MHIKVYFWNLKIDLTVQLWKTNTVQLKL